ncbi:hypothetical protein [Hymenobacter lucidus]|uniref:Lipoprotein n=1 Tax=Hymenobacter lucidus TaxID=2880930 RepID=A0ABS8AQV7_9BACT|nr:hypothetical protein [Hymenobacter lucidus]MCB2408607.1 hypothetical protein [Hymenobacter lucidus]
MKKNVCLLALAAAFGATSCQQELPELIVQETCGSKTVIKENVLGEGRVFLDKKEQLYTIHAKIPGTFNAPTVGFICGQLPEAFRKDSLPVSFTGTYRAFDKYAPPSGVEYYYLSPSKLEIITGE